MGRGRPPSVSDERLLIELLLRPGRGVLSSEVVESVDVTNQTVRTRMADLEAEGLVEVSEPTAGRLLYRLSEEGRAAIGADLRDHF